MHWVLFFMMRSDDALMPEEIRALIRIGEITMAGNKRLKIYGKLSCSSGKRMNPENRVFFKSEEEALSLGFRPCGHCLREKFLNVNLRKNQV